MTKNVVIVGGGIVGCMTAMELVGRGCKVTIVERNQIASQTSGESSWAGGGIVFPLLPWLYSDPVNILTSYGANAYAEICQRMLRETGIDTGFEQSGFLLLPKFDTDAAITWCANNNVPAHEVKATAFGVQSLSGEDALWLPTVCQVRPPYFMQAMRKWLEQNNVTMLEHTELVPLKETQKLNEWQTVDGKTITADQFVVTSGA